MIVFAFGLVHGLGFAGALRELGLPSGKFVTGIVSFNIGLEFGQLVVIGLAFLAVSWPRRRNWYRARVVLPASGMIAFIGAFWTIKRILF